MMFPLASGDSTLYKMINNILTGRFSRLDHVHQSFSLILSSGLSFLRSAQWTVSEVENQHLGNRRLIN